MGTTTPWFVLLLKTIPFSFCPSAPPLHTQISVTMKILISEVPLHYYWWAPVSSAGERNYGMAQRRLGPFIGDTKGAAPRATRRIERQKIHKPGEGRAPALIYLRGGALQVCSLRIMKVYTGVFVGGVGKSLRKTRGKFVSGSDGLFSFSMLLLLIISNLSDKVCCKSRFE